MNGLPEHERCLGRRPTNARSTKIRRSMRDEVGAASKNVSRLVDPLRVDGGVETLDMTPPRLFGGVALGGIAKTNAHDVVFSKNLLDGFGDGVL